MPVVFNTGEREPRPLFPDQVAYTTAQKVADILQIPFPDPVELTENSGTGGAGFVKISPADHRLVGFEAGDKVEIASDASMGETMTIADNGVTRDGAHVKITFTGNMTDDHLTADVATIQSLQSFTNGKRRGVTRKAVETMILRMQDKIDNLTNNSWRPMLQTAEYLNFDTYKPYRRRYYTDYVGTVPLMFRNVQQILRLEIWQGQEYREVGAAEARLEILDHSALTTNDYLFLCPGGGGVASLQVGTGSSKWSADFDGVNAAQQLADLINKDLRRKKDSVVFSPSFNLETSAADSGTTVANVHHEFMASANADYGNSKLKITSMNRGEAGETATLGMTNLTAMSATNLTDTTVTVTGAHAGNQTITMADTSALSPFGIICTGTGSSVKCAYYTGKTATTLTGVTDLASSGLLASVSNGTVLTQYRLKIDYFGQGTGDEARLRDWWCDYDLGIIYFNNTYPYFQWNSVKASYVYGERYVEKAIEDICTKMVAMDLLLSDDRSVLMPEGTTNIDLGAKYQLMKAQVAETLPRYMEVVTLD
tara:strand:+ start:482 stop:2098 length:1617 start_codon:yes stop_codon:yes gene_type:complete